MAHKQVCIGQDAYGEDTEVDELIAPLIRRLWDLGFDTVMSCQGGPPYSPALGAGPKAWIEFETRAEAQEFAQVMQSVTEVIVDEREHPTDETYVWFLHDDLAKVIDMAFEAWKLEA